MYERVVKRFLDIVLSLLGIVFFAPLMLATLLIIRIDDPGPVIFRQKRVGKNKELFELYKFRSMKLSTPDIPTHLMHSPELYLTRTGSFIRRYSIDELPQLFNILKGDMSVVGPRPALWNQDDLISERDKYKVNDIKPGLTGWAQINGRDEISIEMKAKFDGDYKNNLSFMFDVKCFLLTILKVLKHEGVIK